MRAIPTSGSIPGARTASSSPPRFVPLPPSSGLTPSAHSRCLPTHERPGNLREPEALDAIDLGARRIDFLAFKFQTADTIADGYRHLYDGLKDPEISRHASRDLYAVSGNNGECEDLRDGYSYLRARFSDVWLMENRPFWLENVTARYDAAMQLWMQRSSKLNAARLQWSHVTPFHHPKKSAFRRPRIETSSMIPLSAPAPHLRILDLGLVLAYLAGVTLFGLRFRKSNQGSLRAYFLADRNIPWWALRSPSSRRKPPRSPSSAFPALLTRAILASCNLLLAIYSAAS